MSDERALVLAWAAGDRAAGREIVTAHYDAVARFFRTKAGPDADDLVQRTFLRCHERAATFEGTGRFRAFIFAVARFVLASRGVVELSSKVGEGTEFSLRFPISAARAQDGLVGSA